MSIKLRFFPHITASFAALLVLGAVWVLERQERTRFQTAHRVNVVNKLHAVESALEAKLDRNLALSRGLVAYVSTHPELDAAEFEGLARVLVAQQPDVESVHLSRAGTKLGEEGENYTYSIGDRPFDWQTFDRNRRTSIEQIVKSRNSIVEPPINLPDGRSIAIERAPIFITPPGASPESGTYWGSVSLALDLTSVLQEVGALNPLSSLKYSLRGSDASPDGTVFVGDGAIFQQQPSIVNVDLPQGYWQLAAVPKTGWKSESPMLWWLRGGGGVLAALVGISLFKGLDDPRRQRQVLERETRGLREKETLYRELVESAHCAIVRLDIQHQITYANPFIQRLLGYSETELLGQPMRAFLPPAAHDTVNPLLAAIESSLFYPHPDIDCEAQILGSDDRTLSMAWRGKALVDPLGQVNGILCVGRDISDRAGAEVELRASELELRSLLAAMTDLIFVLDDGGRFLKAAPTSPDSTYRWDPTGRTLAEVFDSEKAEEFLEAIQKALSTQMPQSFKYSLTLEDKEVWFGASLSPMSADTVIWVARDISDRVRVETELRSIASELENRVQERAGEIQKANKQLQIEIVERMQIDEALRQSEAREREKAGELEQTLEKLQLTQAQLVHTEKMSGLGEIAAGMAHEINNPVGFIHGNLAHVRDYTQDLLDLVDLYQEEYPQANDRIEDCIDEIDLEFLREDIDKMLVSMESGTDRIRNIILSLRNFSRLDESESKPVKICEGLESTLLMQQHLLHRHPNLPEIEVIREWGELPKVECYPSQLNQVFSHLISNAIEALDEQRPNWTDKPNDDRRFPRGPHPSICIRTQLLEGDRIAVSISDNGPGIPPEIEAKIFNPFFTTKPVGKGTGLGLSVSYQIITEIHQGALTCVSEPGRGTCFKIEIPIWN